MLQTPLATDPGSRPATTRQHAGRRRALRLAQSQALTQALHVEGDVAHQLPATPRAARRRRSRQDGGGEQAARRSRISATGRGNGRLSSEGARASAGGRRRGRRPRCSGNAEEEGRHAQQGVADQAHAPVEVMPPGGRRRERTRHRGIGPLMRNGDDRAGFAKVARACVPGRPACVVRSWSGVPMTSDTIIARVEGRTGRLSLNRPEALHALRYRHVARP